MWCTVHITFQTDQWLAQQPNSSVTSLQAGKAKGVRLPVSHRITQGDSVPIPGTGFQSPGFQNPDLEEKPALLPQESVPVPEARVARLSLHCLRPRGLPDPAMWRSAIQRLRSMDFGGRKLGLEASLPPTSWGTLTKWYYFTRRQFPSLPKEDLSTYPVGYCADQKAGAEAHSPLLGVWSRISN